MKAITIWQPWASLIAVGAKRFEFRGWPAHAAFRGQRIAIHAGAHKVKGDEVKELLLKLRGPHANETGLVAAPAIELLERAITSPGLLPLSSILCTAVLGQPIRDNKLAEQLGLPAIADSDRTEHSNWGWPLTDIIVLEPFVPARGAQGFWDWNGATP